MVLFTLAVGVLAGLEFTNSSAGRVAVEIAILSVAAFGGVLLFILGVKRMELFVVVLLFLRSSLDVSRLNGSEQTQTISNPSSLVALLFLAMGLAWILARRAGGSGTRPASCSGP